MVTFHILITELLNGHHAVDLAPFDLSLCSLSLSPSLSLPLSLSLSFKMLPLSLSLTMDSCKQSYMVISDCWPMQHGTILCGWLMRLSSFWTACELRMYRNMLTLRYIHLSSCLSVFLGSCLSLITNHSSLCRCSHLFQWESLSSHYEKWVCYDDCSSGQETISGKNFNTGFFRDFVNKIFYTFERGLWNFACY